MSEVWQLPITQTLFDLTYLKSKALHDREMIKQSRVKINTQNGDQ